MNNTNKIILIIISLAIIGGGYFLFTNKKPAPPKSNTANLISKKQTQNNQPTLKKTVKLTGETKEFTIEAFQFGFNPATIKVNLGDTVRIIASSRDVPHSFTLPDFGVDLYLNGLKTETIEFVADKKGTFTFFCNVPCGSGHNSMRGVFTVI